VKTEDKDRTKSLKDISNKELDEMLERMRQRGELDKNWWRM